MQIEYDLIQSPNMSWKNVHHLWLLFPAFSKNDEHFWKPFGFLEIFWLNLVNSFNARVWTIPISGLKEI